MSLKRVTNDISGQSIELYINVPALNVCHMNVWNEYCIVKSKINN